MDKPINMSVKEYLMRTMSLRTNTPLKHIEAVVEHQFQEAHDALRKPTVKSVEISGLGKFLFMNKKAENILTGSEKKIGILEKMIETGLLTEEEVIKNETKIKTLTQYIDILKEKIYGDITDNRGVAQQVDTSEGTETNDPDSLSGEKEDV